MLKRLHLYHIKILLKSIIWSWLSYWTMYCIFLLLHWFVRRSLHIIWSCCLFQRIIRGHVANHCLVDWNSLKGWIIIWSDSLNSLDACKSCLAKFKSLFSGIIWSGILRCRNMRTDFVLGFLGVFKLE